ncbi:hypothetical protein F5Y14DRAFT_460562 [Nemania sp. NC0429]|nr:hypothetical protein F5Y14DRAFT_460562 [Nemania sp. NC0429]
MSVDRQPSPGSKRTDPAVRIIIKEAESLISKADLPYPSPELLECFIYLGLNPKAAAEYIINACQSSNDSTATLMSLVESWTFIVEAISKHGQAPPEIDASLRAEITLRDGGRDCITGKRGTLWDPLVVRPIIPVPSQWLTDDCQISAMLGVFFTESYRDWWLDHAREPHRMHPLRYHWLVRESSASIFSQGLIALHRNEPSTIEYTVEPIMIGTMKEDIEVDGRYPLLGDHSRMGTLNVDYRFLGTHCRLSPTIRWLEVARQMSLSRKVPNTPSLASTLANAFPIPSLVKVGKATLLGIVLPLWLMVPRRARIAVYKGLRQVGRRLYGQRDSPAQVQKLPFGLYLKFSSWPDSHQNEFNALKLIRKYTSIPVPRPLDVITIPATAPGGESYKQNFLLTTRMPGRPIADRETMFSDQDCAEYVAQMQDIITQLRTIPRPEEFEFAICNTLGGPCRDGRIRWSNQIGPFKDEEAFNQSMLYSDDPARRGHRIVFTHADLNARNILVNQVIRPDGTWGWEVSGIVDWEGSGYYPEYWDYTKSLYEGFRFGARWCDMAHRIFEVCGDLKKELEVERRSWRESIF